MENCISREATYGTLNRLNNWQKRAHTTSSKLKRSETKPSSISSAAAPKLPAIVRSAVLAVASRRSLAHAGVLAATAAVVLAGNLGNTAAPATTASSAAMVSAAPVQLAATATVAANVAQKTDFVASHDVAADAKTLNNRVTLATTDDATLAKQQIVTTSSQVTRDPHGYTVAPGDTLSSIAAKFNVTTDTVRWANGLPADATMKPGQTLMILPVSGLVYKVQPGDTAETIAGKYQSNAAQILSFNDAEVSGLQPGANIIIPDGVLQEAAPVTQLAASTTRASSTTTAAATPSVRLTPGGANGYAYGYCTYYVASRRGVPGNWGDAVSWYGNAAASGYGVGSTPAPGAIAWTGAGYYGHVAYVESVSGNMVTVSEMNFNGNWGRVTSRTVPASSFRYIY